MRKRGALSILSDRIETPIGPLLLLARDGALVGLEFDDQPERIAKDLRLHYGTSELFPAPNPHGFSDRIRAYFAGDFKAIEDLPTEAGGTDFQRRVWAELKLIPCGTTISYGELARRLGDSNLMRAVGAANGRNPVSIVVPCHRVIGADGTLTGYGGGLPRKKWLLTHEGISISGDRLSPQPDFFD